MQASTYPSPQHESDGEVEDVNAVSVWMYTSPQPSTWPCLL